VLDIARIEAGKLSISLEPVPARDVVHGALDLVRLQAAGRNIRLPEAFTCDAYVMADRQRLQQVLLNLFSNAIKYNRPGGAVSVNCDTGPSDRIRLTVADDGPGIAPELMPRLFTPFDRLDTPEPSVEGTGLGLALSRGLVELMGGTLSATSTVGEGSRFTVELPAAESPTRTVERTGGPLAVEPADAGPRGTVLYIEDNSSNLRLVERIVDRRPGVALLSAMQGRRGLELARDHRPDLILLDLHLPDMPGQDVLAELRADPATREIPVVILSADATPSQASRLVQAGAHAYLTKPLVVSQLLMLLDELLVGAVRSS
jgi:CheY-like chemotaxis protein/anti-sigma regulatory factor (Ser/Thr protein kinase)